MKRLAAAILLCIVAIACAEHYRFGKSKGQTPWRYSNEKQPADMEDDCVLWMTFEEDDGSPYYDYSTSANDGAQGTAGYRPAYSNANGGFLDFDGGDDVVSFGASPSWNSDSAGAVAAWLYARTDTDFPRILHLGGANVAAPGRWGFRRQGSGAALAPKKMSVWVKDEGDGSWDVSLYGSTDINVGSWYHIVLSSSGSAHTMYVNGLQQSLTVDSGANNGDWFADVSIASPEWTTIGAHYDGADSTAAASLDDLRIYSRALTSNEVLGIANDTGATYYEYFSEDDFDFDDYMDLALYLPMSEDNGDGTYTDKGPLANDGAQGTAGYRPAWSSGNGGSLYFDGSDDFIDIDSLTASISPVSVSAWFNTDSEDVTQTIVTKERGFILRYEDSNFLYLYFYDSNWSSLAGSTSLSSNTWYHGAFTFDGTNAKLYLNGGEENSGTDSMASESYPVQAGARTPSVGPTIQFFDGAIDDCRIYDRALTSNEVYTIYNDTKATYGL